MICFLGSLSPTVGAQPGSLSLHSRWSPRHPRRCGRVLFLGWGQDPSHPTWLHSRAARGEPMSPWGQQMSPWGPGAQGSTGRDRAPRGQWPDGFYSPGTTWHVVDMVFPSTTPSFDGILSLPVCAHQLHQVILMYHFYPSLLAFYTFVHFRCPMQHPLAPVGLFELQQAETMPSNPNNSQFLGFLAQSLSLYSHPLSQCTALSTAAA